MAVRTRARSGPTLPDPCRGVTPPAALLQGAGGHDTQHRWERQQCAQVLKPIREILMSTPIAVIAERAGLSEHRVGAVLDGRREVAATEVIRLAWLGQVELFGLAGRDLVTRGPELPAEERELLAIYRAMPPDLRRRFLTELVTQDRPGPTVPTRAR